MDLNINIGGDNHDDAYRYKMPRLVTKVEGRGNGIRTVIVNMSAIAKALRVPPGYTTKFFGCELGARSEYDAKNDKAEVNGCHSSEALASLLQRFIEKFVLCRNCKLPELEMFVDTRKQTVSFDCNACGWHGAPDMNHKLVPFILRNPPSNSSRPKKTASNVADKKAAKAAMRRARSGEVKAVPQSGNDAGNDSDSEEWTPDLSVDRDRALREQKRAEEEARAALAQAQRNLVQDLATESMQKYVSESERDLNQVIEEMKNLQLSHGLDKAQVFNVASRSLIDPTNNNILKQTQRYGPVFALLAKSDDSFQKQLIVFLEEICFVKQPSFKTKLPMLLKVMYDCDALEEDTILAWYNTPSLSADGVDAADARKLVKPFVDWLNEAEEEEEDGEEEEEDGDDDDDE